MSDVRHIPDATDLLRDARTAMDELKQRQIIGEDVFQPSYITTENAFDIDFNPSSIPLRVMWEWRVRYTPKNDTDVNIGNAIKLRRKSVMTPSAAIDGTLVERVTTDGSYDEWRVYASVNSYPTRQQIKLFVQAVGDGTITVERVA